MNNVQHHSNNRQSPEQQGRILGRTLGREINPDEAMLVTGGIQSITGVYDKNTGKLKQSDDGGMNDA